MTQMVRIMVSKMAFLKRFFLLLSLASALALSACSGNGSAPISKKKMAKLLLDVHISQSTLRRQEMVNISHPDRLKYYKSVLDKHGITEAEFDSAVTWYALHPDEYKKVYKIVNDSLRKRINKLEQ